MDHFTNSEISEMLKLCSSPTEQNVKGRLDEFIKSIFKAEMAAQGRTDCAEIPSDLAGLLFDKIATTDKPVFNNGKTKLEQYLSIKYQKDTLDFIVNPGLFMSILKDTIKDYVRCLPKTVSHVAVPVLFLERRAYMMEFFLYGYIGMPLNCKD